MSFLIGTMTRAQKSKVKKSNRRKIRKSTTSTRSTHRKTTQHRQRTNKTANRKKTRSKKVTVMNQKGGSDFLRHLLSGLAAGALTVCTHKLKKTVKNG